MTGWRNFRRILKNKRKSSHWKTKRIWRKCLRKSSRTVRSIRTSFRKLKKKGRLRSRYTKQTSIKSKFCLIKTVAHPNFPTKSVTSNTNSPTRRSRFKRPRLRWSCISSKWRTTIKSWQNSLWIPVWPAQWQNYLTKGRQRNTESRTTEGQWWWQLQIWDLPPKTRKGHLRQKITSASSTQPRLSTLTSSIAWKEPRRQKFYDQYKFYISCNS